MKKIILTGILAISTLLQADSYLLTMSKDDNVCQHMYKVFNGDMHSKGKLVFEDHKEFNWLKWDKKLDFIEPFGNYVGDYFDINNDGKKEVVAFSRKRFDLKWDEGLYYFSMDLKNNISGKKVLGWREINREHLHLGRTIFDYALREYPIKIQKYFAGKERSYYPILSNPYIRPLKIKDNYFIALIGNVDIYTLRSDKLEDKNSIIIQKFIPKNIAEDICYYIKATQLNKKDPSENPLYQKGMTMDMLEQQKGKK